MQTAVVKVNQLLDHTLLVTTLSSGTIRVPF